MPTYSVNIFSSRAGGPVDLRSGTTHPVLGPQPETYKIALEISNIYKIMVIFVYIYLTFGWTLVVHVCEQQRLRCLRYWADVQGSLHL